MDTALNGFHTQSIFPYGSGSEMASAPRSEPEGNGTSGVQPNDVAGVLKRNQACLACRRRKLKCDAVRPHCSTCVRSHRHLMRTAPRTNPVLSCEYDDGPEGPKHDEPVSSVHRPSISTTGRRDTPDDGGSVSDEAYPGAQVNGASGLAKKRKASSSAAAPSRKKSSELNKVRDEEDKLREKIRELEAQLASSRGSSTAPVSAPNAIPEGTSSRPWSSDNSGFGQIGMVPSPTTFLDMLSSAATAQPGGPAAQAHAGPLANGLRTGVSESTMMTGTATGFSWPPGTPRDLASASTSTNTGLTPFFTAFNDAANPPGGEAPVPQASISRASSDRPTPGNQPGSSGSSVGHSTGLTPFTVPDQSPAPALSPSGIFNFTPGPTGPTAPSPRDNSWAFRGFKGVDTVDSVLNAAVNMVNGGGISEDAAAGVPDAAAEAFQSANGLPQLDEAVQQQLLLDLFWPGWPVHLPEPHIVNALVDAFFDLVPALPRMLHRPRFLARLALPPTHTNFPHPALIHAICALAANWCAPSIYERSKAARVLDARGRPMSFGLRQASLAKEAVQDGLNTGNRMFDVVRAMMVLSRIFIDDTRMLECWAFNGLVARMILPLGLNVRSASLSLKSVMLPPPGDALEREERRAAMWFAMYHDTVSSSASGWGTSISLDELTIPLPVSTKDFEAGLDTMESNPQDLESPDLFTRHPVPDPFVMVLKASALLNRVNRFARKWKNRHLKDNDDFEGMQKPEFRELANSIACLQMTFPANLRNCTKRDAKRRLDSELITAHLVPHAATICLYEPFADIADPQDLASRRLLTAAQSIGSIVQQLVTDTQDTGNSFTSIMHSSASICLVTAARTQLLFYRHALNARDQVAADMHRADIELLKMALNQYGQKFKIGHHHAQLVEYFIDRASNPTYEQLQTHYPDHPRTGAPELRPGADLGLCVANALNIKRGFWRLPNASANRPAGASAAGISPFGSTPGSSVPAASRADSMDAGVANGGSTGGTPQMGSNEGARIQAVGAADRNDGGSMQWPCPTAKLVDGRLVQQLGPDVDDGDNNDDAAPHRMKTSLKNYTLLGNPQLWPGFEDTLNGIGTGGPPPKPKQPIDQKPAAVPLVSAEADVRATWQWTAQTQ